MRKLFELVLLSITLVLLMVSTANASMIETHSIEFDIISEEITHTKVSIEYSDLTTDKVSYLVFSRIENLLVSDNVGVIECDVDSRTYGTQISCIPNEIVQGTYIVEFEFDSHRLVTQNADSFIFSYNYGIKDPTNKLNVKLILPEGTGLINAEDITPYYPSDAKISSLFGRRTALEWEIVDPSLGKTYNFNTNYEDIGSSTQVVTYMYVAIAIVLASVLFVFFKNKSTKTASAKRVFSVLKKDEKKVIDIILEKGDNCKQRDIVKITDFSKAKVSRIIVDLEERGLIEKIRKGRTNRIILKDESIKSK